MVRQLATIFALALCVSFAQGSRFSPDTRAAEPESSSIQLLTLKTHSRLIFHIDEGVPAEWKDLSGGFELNLKGVGMTDLGAPFGAEEQWARTLGESLRDSRIAQIRFQETGFGLKISGKWKF